MSDSQPAESAQNNAEQIGGAVVMVLGALAWWYFFMYEPVPDLDINPNVNEVVSIDNCDGNTIVMCSMKIDSGDGMLLPNSLKAIAYDSDGARLTVSRFPSQNIVGAESIRSTLLVSGEAVERVSVVWDNPGDGYIPQ